MAIEAKEEFIGDYTYKFTHLPTTKSIALLTALLKMLGPGIRALKSVDPTTLVVDAPGGKKLGRMPVGVIAEALGELMARATEEEILRLTDRVFQTVQIDMKGDGSYIPLKGVLDIVLAGKPSLVFKILAAAVQWQYADFFDSSASSAAQAPTMKPNSAGQESSEEMSDF